MKINGVELENLDILDLNVAEKVEKEIDKIVNINEKVKGVSMSESIRIQCTAIFNLFNVLFGEGTDKKIFGDKVNLLTCLKAFEELIEFFNSQKNDYSKLVKKYSPNRVQRRKK